MENNTNTNTTKMINTITTTTTTGSCSAPKKFSATITLISVSHIPRGGGGLRTSHAHPSSADRVDAGEDCSHEKLDRTFSEYIARCKARFGMGVDHDDFGDYRGQKLPAEFDAKKKQH